jgi:hypothetical protein
MNEQELRAWSLLIASLMKGPFQTNDTDYQLSVYEKLADDIATYIANGKEPFTDPRFQPAGLNRQS